MVNITRAAVTRALGAVAYIAAVAFFLYYGKGFIGPDDSVLNPMAMLSLLVLSVAVMAYLFFFEPVKLLLDGKRNEAATLFVRTLAVFAFVTVLLFAALLAFSAGGA